ncbi:hypothetical protein [Deminuibacter soli]|uniref:Uncharacterized protein n=1 Tax=Deminuibacter soli TaxID=2291815 RepID=A0A3E1ND42_9BACT|nr:hypothetical protein [Deminuibacter soli]RFM25925.1 hypothetical protein DXN05_22675 [Deminuibacter soli]
MRKLTAILLLALFLFNLAGYRIWFYYARQQAARQFEAAIDHSQYNNEDLITISVPISMPYQVEQSEFERVDGEITLNGKVYKYVQRKVADGMLILQCLPDERSTHIKKAGDAYLQFANDISATQDHAKKAGHPPVSGVAKYLFSDFMPAGYAACAAPYTLISSATYAVACYPLVNAATALPDQPPETRTFL